MSPRNQLLEKCVGYFLSHGLANISLRPLAAATGTSARMLVHHFGSKEGLIAAAMERVHGQFQDSLQAIMRQPHPAGAAGIMQGFWKLISAPANRPFMRLLFEVQILALQNPGRYARYLARTSNSWLRLIMEAMPGQKSSETAATLFTAVIDGLMLELLATGDARRTSSALRLFVKRHANTRASRDA